MFDINDVVNYHWCLKLIRPPICTPSNINQILLFILILIFESNLKTGHSFSTWSNHTKWHNTHNKNIYLTNNGYFQKEPNSFRRTCWIDVKWSVYIKYSSIHKMTQTFYVFLLYLTICYLFISIHFIYSLQYISPRILNKRKQHNAAL